MKVVDLEANCVLEKTPNMTSETPAPLHEVTSAVLSIVKLIARHPEDLDVSETVSGSNLAIKLSPRTEDMGTIIGKQGAQIKAIKFIAEQMGRAKGFTCVVCELVESYKGTYFAGPQFQPNPGYRGEDILETLHHSLELLFDVVPEFDVLERAEKLYFIFDVDESAVPIILALGSAFYPVCYRGGRKVHFRVKGYKPKSDNENLQRSKAPADP